VTRPYSAHYLLCSLLWDKSTTFSCIAPQIICKKQRNLKVTQRAGSIHLSVPERETLTGNCPEILSLPLIPLNLFPLSKALAPALAYDHFILVPHCPMPKTMCHSPRFGKQRSSIDGRPVTDLYEIPALMEAALDLLAIEELREAAFHVIHQAAGIG